MKRILILGVAGSGKSILAVKIGQILKLPVIHLDRYFWRPYWERVPEDEFKEKVKKLAMKEKWVMDGNYTARVFTMRVKRADVIIYLDFPRRASYLRLFLRFLRHRGKTRFSIAENCPERLDWDFMKYIWSYPNRNKPRVLRYLKEMNDEKEVFILHNQRQIDRFVELLKIRTKWVDRNSALYTEFRLVD